MKQPEANGAGWPQCRRGLERAIDEGKDFAFETTLSGNTIASLLKEAITRGIAVRIWYLGLESPELHIARVRSRVELGGHDISEAKIRERYARSRTNLIELQPNLTELKIFDNTEEGDPQKGQTPAPKLLLHQKERRIVSWSDLRAVPKWAKRIIQIAISTGRKS